MKLSKLTIRNYRGIKELSINMENISVIIGPNNVGKSTILQALMQFGASDKKLDSSDYYRHNTDNPISFHATFTNLTPEETQLHGTRVSLHEETGDFIVRAIYPYGSDVSRASKKSGSPTHDMEDDGWDGKMGGGNNASHFLSVFPEVIYIPAVKDASDELNKNSAHMKTLTALYKEVISSLEEYVEAEEKTKQLQSKINEHNDEKIRFFEAEVQEFLKDVTATKISFNVHVNPVEEIVKTAIAPLFNYNGTDTDIKFQGTGVQRTFILSILKGYKKYVRRFPKDAKEQQLTSRPLIIAIEEPELYLHPHISRIFKDTLYGLADDGYFQVVATSHSPNFIDLSKPHRTLAKLSLDSVNTVCVNQVNSDVYGLPDEERDRFHALLKFNPYVNEVFFADNAILVEGDTEVVAFKLIGEKLAHDSQLDAELFHRTSIVNCAGKGTMYVLLNVLNNFGVRYSVVHDYDIKETNSKGERRTPATLRMVLTLNHKLEQLAKERGNRKFVFQHTFEAEMPDDYEQGTSKSFSAYEYIKDKELRRLPVGLVNIVKAAYGIGGATELDHSNENLLGRYTWSEVQAAKAEWKTPDDSYIIRNWSNE
ncbi:ATP-dependent nuclease [Ferroacidibacillus organovorans]|uniref:ATP-dependent endonuclease n=1 Tax=Ferroacidibacillus organovorans TaxID=1765683 RepID=A0A1V4ETN1_9BACL|nr:AAA family ATPase [Ferroacidibacillus organovorans]OPG16295.1 ATP-dependent endonuclease [Ferroacidibacillus organovorans]